MKRHPDRLNESEGVYKNYFDSVISKPFESVFSDADAILFTDITSTTFPFILEQNKPVIIFKTALDFFIAVENHENIKSICTIIPSHFDNDNNFIFEEKDLLDSLQ